jgi:hypothetical protein
MANELVIYTTPPDATVQLRLDSGQTLTGTPGTYNGRTDAHLMHIPPEVTTGRGSELAISRAGSVTFKNRGLLVPSATGPAQFFLDDVHLVAEPTTPQPPTPGPPSSTDPLERIQAIYATGQYSLVSKEGCGLFTEAVATDFATFYGMFWGHVFKNPGQNQYNKHAVDAIHSLYGEKAGIWDIITSSASTSAKPAFNRAGDVNPVIWRPHLPVPCQDDPSRFALDLTAGRALREVIVIVRS